MPLFFPSLSLRLLLSLLSFSSSSLARSTARAEDITHHHAPDGRVDVRRQARVARPPRGDKAEHAPPIEQVRGVEPAHREDLRDERREEVSHGRGEVGGVHGWCLFFPGSREV